jgi:DNA polymerase-3 subunit delta
MILNALNLSAHLKNGLGDLYVLTGKEVVLLDDTVKLLIAAYTESNPQQPIQKVTLWIEESKDWEKLQSHTQHYSLFKSTLLINASYQKTSLDQQAKAWLTHYSSQPTADLLVILQAPNLNPKSLHALFQKTPRAHVVDVPMLKDQSFVQFIDKRLQQTKLQYHKTIPAFIGQLTQGNVLEAIQYINQLSLLVPPSQPIDIDLLTQLISDVALFPLYTFAESCVQGNTESTLRQLQRIQLTDTEPLLLLWWLTKITRQCLQMHHAINHKENLDETCKMLGIWSSQKQTYLKACQRLPTTLLKSILARCKQLDTLLKSNPPAYIWDQFEHIALSFCDPRFILSPQSAPFSLWEKGWG